MRQQTPSGDLDKFAEDLRRRLVEYSAIPPAAGTDYVQPVLENAGWTEEGAKELAGLARKYGAWFLSHATALATVLGIEDGENGL